MTTTINASTSSGLINTADTSGILQLQTAGTAALTIDTSANVGIGTSSPSYRIDARASSGIGISFIENTSGNTNRIQLGASSGLGYINADAGTGSVAMALQVAGSTKATLDQSGNLGLGVTPSAWDSTYKAFQISRSSFSGVGTAGVFANNIYYSSGWKRIAATGAGSYVIDANTHAWNIAASGIADSAITWTQAMTLDASGNVGIGTASPGQKLAVISTSGTLSNSAIRVNSTTGTASANSGLYLSGSQSTSHYNWLVGSQYNVNAALEITPSTAVDGATFTTPVAVFTQAGNVGIGTSSPSQKLHVAGKTYFATTSGGYEGGFVSGGTNTYSLLYATSTSGTLYMGVNGTSGGTPIDVGGISDNASFFGSRSAHSTQLISNNSVRATIDSSGNFFVGYSSSIIGNERFGISQPTATYWAQAIQLNNTANGIIITNTSGTGSYTAVSFRNNGTTLSLCGSITVSGTTTSYATSSDYRLKENVQPMQNALATVQQLKPVTYDWASTKQAGQGFIAHELQAVFPDAVVGEKDAVDAEGNPQYQGIDTSFLVATLTAAIQELKQVVDAQTSTIQSLTDRITQLESK